MLVLKTLISNCERGLNSEWIIIELTIRLHSLTYYVLSNDTTTPPWISNRNWTTTENDNLVFEENPDNFYFIWSMNDIYELFSTPLMKSGVFTDKW